MAWRSGCRVCALVLLVVWTDAVRSQEVLPSPREINQARSSDIIAVGTNDSDGVGRLSRSDYGLALNIRVNQDAFTARIYTRPSVNAVTIPASSSLPPGEDLSHTLRFADTTGPDIDFQGAGYVTPPWGEPFLAGPVDGPTMVHLAPLGSRTVTFSHRLPIGTPHGRYHYTLRVWQGADTVVDEATFPFTVENP